MKIVKSTKKRKRTALSAPKRRTKRAGGLSQMFSPTTAKNSFKNTAAAFGGGLAARKASQLAYTVTGGKNNLVVQLGLALVGGFMMHSMLNAPNLASGFVGGMAAMNSADMGLGEDDVFFADEEALSDMPDALDENGNPMSLEEFEEYEEVY